MSLRATVVTVAGAAVVAIAAKRGRKRIRRAIGVYVEEVSSGSRPIEAVGTSIAAFVGVSP